jgi:ribosome recycling factor
MSIIDDVMDDLQSSIDSSLASMGAHLAKLRTGRANLAILDGIRVEYYGVPTPLNQCANMAVVDARLIQVKPFDKNLVGDIDKAILAADIGITPQSDGEVIRLPVPALTEERRRELVKQAKQRGEEARIAMRGHRRDANDMLKEAEKEKEISQDDLKRALDQVQQVTDKGTEKVDDILVVKEKEILEI